MSKKDGKNENKMKYECKIDIRLIGGKGIFSTTEGDLSCYVVFKVGDFQAQSRSLKNTSLDPDWNDQMRLAFIRETPNVDLLIQLFVYDNSESLHQPKESSVRVIRHLEQRLVAGYETTYTNYKLSNNTILTFSLLSKDIGFQRENIGIAEEDYPPPRETPIDQTPPNSANKRHSIFSLFSKKKSKKDKDKNDFNTPMETPHHNDSPSTPKGGSVKDEPKRKSGPPSNKISLAERITAGLKSSLRFLGLDDMSAAQLVNFETGDGREDSYLNEVWKSYRIRYEELKIKGITSHNRQIFFGKWKDKEIVFKPYSALRLKKKKDVDTHKSFSRQFRGFVKISQHKNIIAFYGIVVKSRRIGLVVEYCKFGDLRSFLKVNPHYGIRDRYNLLFDVICGMRYIHSKGIVHRDICPENIMIDENGVAKITNFEKSRIKDSGGAQQTASVGKDRYMANECLEGRYSEKSDVYSFGIIILETLSNNFDIKWNSSTKAILELKQCGILTEWLFGVINRTLRDNPSARPTFLDIQKQFLINIPNIRIPDQPLDLFVYELSEYKEALEKEKQKKESDDYDYVFEDAYDFTLNPSELSIKTLKEMIHRNVQGITTDKKIDKIWWRKSTEDSKKKVDDFYSGFIDVKTNEDVYLLDNESLLVFTFVKKESKRKRKKKKKMKENNNNKKEEEIEGEEEEEQQQQKEKNKRKKEIKKKEVKKKNNESNKNNSTSEKKKTKKKEVLKKDTFKFKESDNNNKKKKDSSLRVIYLKLPNQNDVDADDVLLQKSSLENVIDLIYKSFPDDIIYSDIEKKKKRKIKKIICTRLNTRIYNDSHVKKLTRDDMLTVHFEGIDDKKSISVPKILNTKEVEEEIEKNHQKKEEVVVVDDNKEIENMKKIIENLTNENKKLVLTQLSKKEKKEEEGTKIKFNDDERLVIINQQKELINQQKELIDELKQDKKEFREEVKELKLEIKELRKKK